ncbi:MAG TPA: AMP-binding protein [Candidatus Eisenbacteria bacterium]|nr:AMP-binding protein [Candidatus Eisenbacteria bacterium]
MPRPNLNSLFDDFARYASHVAVVQRRGYRRESWTYAKLRSVAVASAHELRQRGIRTGDRVLLWGPNSAEWMASFWACLLLGAVAVPLDDAATPDFVSRVARETSARIAFTTRGKLPLHSSVTILHLEDLPDAARRASPSSSTGTLACAPINHTKRATMSNPRSLGVGSPDPPQESLAYQPITRNHIAQILFTSGTTAEPRGVVLTHGNFLANLEPLERGIDPYRKYEKWFHPLRFVSLVPLSHVFGQFMALFVPPLLGATVVFENSANPTEITRTIKRERATALIAVPRMLDSLSANLQREFQPANSTTSPHREPSQAQHLGWPTIRASASSEGWVAPPVQPDREVSAHAADTTPITQAAQVSESQPKSWLQETFLAAENKKFLRRAWLFRRIHRRFGWKFWAFISGGAALSPDTEEFFKRIGYAVVQGYGMTETASLISLNHPFRATQGSIGKVLPGREFKLAEDGEILVRGENVSAGYWQSGKLQPSADSEWLYTGDIGELDSEGNLRFRGRKKNVIVTAAGLNVYPEDLEGALRRQPQVRDAVVIPIDHAGNAEPCAVLLTNESSELAAQRAIETANRSLAEYQRIRIWLIWPEPDFPRTPTEKPRLASITARAIEMLSGKQGSTTLPSATSPSLQDLISRFTTCNAGSPSHLEQNLNLTSLDRVELLSALEQRYQVELSETSFAEAKTVSDIETLLRQANVPQQDTPVGARHGSARLSPSQHLEVPAGPAGTPVVCSSPRRFAYAYPRWAQRAPVRWLRLAAYYALVWPATQVLGHPKIFGRENLRDARGPFLIVSNHITRRADIGLILAALPTRYRHHLATAMGGETLREMRRPPQNWFFAKRWAYQLGYWLVTALFNVFPLPQFSGFRESFRFAAESIDRGYSVLVFPEGQVNNSETGEMARFQSGIGLLSQNLRIPIVPMRLDGVWQMKREHRRLAHLGELIVRIGRPVSFPPDTPPEQITTELEFAVRSL